MEWEQIYNFLGIKEFIYFISSPQIQDALFPVKLVFIFCSAYFLVWVVYFMLNSSWLYYNFLEEMVEFFSWEAYGQRQINKQWAKIKKRTETGTELDYKLAIIDADDFLREVLENRGYESESFEENIKKAARLIAPIYEEVLAAHKIRNSIVYSPDFKLSIDQAKKVLDTYEAAIKSIGI